MNDNPLAIHYSRPSAASVAERVNREYGLSINNAVYFVSGLHDNFLLQSVSSRYILRIYRDAWRSPAEIFFELELLSYLAERNFAVAAPVQTRSRANHISLPCAEGERIAVLFPFVDGSAPGLQLNLEQIQTLAVQCAKLHELGREFACLHSRTPLQLPYLLDQSIDAIQPYLDTDGIRELRGMQHLLHDNLHDFEGQRHGYGACSGDINGNNFHVNAEGLVCMFDFDQCGFGARVFDIAKLFSSLPRQHNTKELYRGFLAAYESVAPLNSQERNALSYYEIVARIWVMAIHVYNADFIGHKLLQPEFWNRRMALIREQFRRIGHA